MAYNDNVITPFIEFGNYMRTIINNVEKDNSMDFDKEWLKNIYQKSSNYARNLADIIGKHDAEGKYPFKKEIVLTPRESEVLTLLSRGNTRQEIADNLFISLSGVKKHLASIYKKLGAINRADAIHIASLNNLI